MAARALAIVCLALALSPASAAPLKVAFGDGAASVTIEDRDWRYDSVSDGGLTYVCIRKDCPPATLLRLKREALTGAEALLDEPGLLRAWAGLKVDSSEGKFRTRSIRPAGRRSFGPVTGVELRLKVAGETAYESRLFWKPKGQIRYSVNFTTAQPVRGDILGRLQRAVIPTLELK